MTSTMWTQIPGSPRLEGLKVLKCVFRETSHSADRDALYPATLSPVSFY